MTVRGETIWNRDYRMFSIGPSQPNKSATSNSCATIRLQGWPISRPFRSCRDNLTRPDLPPSAGAI